MSLNFQTKQLVEDVDHYLSMDSSNNVSKLKTLLKKCNNENPYKSSPEKEMWEEQCGINVPLLYISSIYLYIYAKNNNIDTFLFATRDCSQWIKIFKAMYPNEHSVYFNCSRNMLDGATAVDNIHYNRYVNKCLKTTPDRAVFIDVHGTGKRILSYFSKRFNNVLPYSFLLSSSYRKYVEFPDITYSHYKNGKFINLIFDARGSPIEMLNYDIKGTLQTYNKQGEVRDKVEYSTKYLEAYHVCVDYIIRYIDPVNQEEQYNLETLYEMIKKIYRVIQDNKPAISVYIKHPAKHPKIIKK